MPDFTPGGIPFPLVDDKIKDGTSPSALVEDLKTLALGADAHAHSTADTAKTDAIADATTKYGGLPARVAATEAKNAAQDTAIATKADSGHTHDRISHAGAEARLDSSGQFQYVNPSGERVWQVQAAGSLTHGKVPWARLTEIPAGALPAKCVRLEAGKWVWDTTAGTHYVIPDHTGALIVRAAAVPVPAATPALNW